MRKQWSDDEIIYLKKLYEIDGLSLSDIYPLFIKKFNRTKTSISVKIAKLGLKHTKEQKFSIKSKLNKGDKNVMYGKVGINKGLNKKNSDRIKNASEKISNTRKQMYKNGDLEKPIGEKNSMYGLTAWNKGKTKYTDERIMKSTIKMSISRKKYWKSLSENEKNDIIGNLTKYANMARKDTKIEIIIKLVLEKLNIVFIKNYKKSRYIFDFYLPNYNFIIECQGDYWHANPQIYNEDRYTEQQKTNVLRDKRKKDFINKNRYNSLFLWENYIYENKEKLDNIIRNELDNIIQ